MKRKMKYGWMLVLLFISSDTVFGQGIKNKMLLPTSLDSLAGSNHAGRNWWDVQHYTLDIRVDIEHQQIEGRVQIRYKVIEAGTLMMVDLQQPLEITGIVSGKDPVAFEQKGRFCFVNKNGRGRVGKVDSINIFYKGKPKVAVKPPWDGGIDWNHDEKGRPWISTACQGIGASIWWPCKDIQSDEPDYGVDMYYTVPSDLSAVANGKLIEKVHLKDGKTTWHWRVTQPINNYNVSMNIAHYVKISEEYEGRKGGLDVSFYVLDYNLDKGKKLFPEIIEMLECFEQKAGPYPFYEDGYKMIETAHLGMEHQSGIAYGNRFMRGYRGDDRSDTGVGLGWDFILIHESGHEWFGNSITTADVNDGWIHEGFTTYMETIYTECAQGLDAAQRYVIGQRHIITNRVPLINKYGVNFDAPGDIYDKGASLIHTIRTILDDDHKFYAILQEMTKKYSHQTVTSAEIEEFWIRQSGLQLKPIFDQYLRTTQIPTLIYSINDQIMTLHWTNVIPGFEMPVLLLLKDGSRKWVKASEQPVSIKLEAEFDKWDPNIYCYYKKQ
ncbi:MAG: M1 family metallopeptidase [Saprospiraceae bacterium]|nr:M1 family metallopeptidase [Saprospiraceae bacterium]